MEKRESLFYPASVEARLAGGRRIIAGLIPYNSWSQDLGGFVESIAPGAFTRALSGAEPVVLVRAHLDHEIIASTSGGSLTLRDSAQGLRFEAVLRETEPQVDLFEMIRRDAPEVSFGFIVRRDSWPTNTTRRLEDVRLLEITVGLARGQAAYPDAIAEAAVRSKTEAILAEARRQLAWIEEQGAAMAEARRLLAWTKEQEPSAEDALALADKLMSTADDFLKGAPV